MVLDGAVSLLLRCFSRDSRVSIQRVLNRAIYFIKGERCYRLAVFSCLRLQTKSALHNGCSLEQRAFSEQVGLKARNESSEPINVVAGSAGEIRESPSCILTRRCVMRTPTAFKPISAGSEDWMVEDIDVE